MCVDGYYEDDDDHDNKGYIFIQRSIQYVTLHFTQCRPKTCSFRHQLDFYGKHSSHAAITLEDYSFTVPPLSIARYSLIQLTELGRCGENENSQPKLRNGNRGDSNPGSLDGESGILPLRLPMSTTMITMPNPSSQDVKDASNYVLGLHKKFINITLIFKCLPRSDAP